MPGQTGDRRVVVVGAGIGGLAAAAELAARGLEVTVVEAAAQPGGKLRQVQAGGALLDAGPTVFTMRWVFEALFERAGARLEDHLRLVPEPVLARHAWPDGSRLDLHAGREASAQAVRDFAGTAEAGRFLAFCEQAERTYAALEGPFIRGAKPATPLHLIWRGGWSGARAMGRTSPFATLWSGLSRTLRDPRLRQLFGRYATYCGSSPFLAPATLMVVAHVEQQGVWLVEGGMARIADAVASLVARNGGSVQCGCPVRRVQVSDGRVRGVELESGAVLPAQAVVFNGDAAALDSGLLGVALRDTPVPPRERSLSAVTWKLVAPAEGFPLQRHNVFFSADSRTEFDTLFTGRRLPRDPTVYLCAQDRGPGDASPGRPERLFCLVNAPADGDAPALDDSALRRAADAAAAQMRRHGLALELEQAGSVRTAPADFERLYPATGGGLYGRASHGWRASFERPGTVTRVGGLYRAGGSTHPGPGVPMAALSGHLAAQAVLRQFGVAA